MIKTGHSRAPFILILAILAVLIAACGSDELDETVDSAQSTVDSVLGEVDDQTGDIDQDDAEDAQSSLSTTLNTLGLTSLSSAVAGVDITDLTDSDEFTFFAPDDEAFTALSADELADLLADPAALADVLRNHIVEERLDSAVLAERTSVTSASGSELTVEATDGTVTIDGATVVQADQDAGDGVIHVVDRLLLPS